MRILIKKAMGKVKTVLMKRCRQSPFLVALNQRVIARRNLGERPNPWRTTQTLIYKQHELSALYALTVLTLAQKRVKYWWDYNEIVHFFHFNDVPLLRLILREFVLRQAADVRAFLHISRRLNAIGAVAGEEDVIALKIAEEYAAKAEIPVKTEPQVIAKPSCLGVMNGLFSLYAAEKHRLAERKISDLRQMAKIIFETSRGMQDPKAERAQISEIARMLVHFDLLPEAVEFLSDFPEMQSLHDFIAKALQDQAANQAWAKEWRLHYEGEVQVLGITVWGEEHVRFMLDYHFPCLLAAGNVPKLATLGRVIISVATNAAGEAQIRCHPSFAALNNIAQFHFTLFTQTPSRATPESASEFYRRYGLLDHHHIYLARALGANLYMLPTDCVLSSSAYSRLHAYLQEGYDCCSTTCIESDKDRALPVLDGMKDHGGALSLDGKWLLNLAARTMTQYFRSFIFSPKHKPIPYPREFFWRVKGGYVCHSIYVHPVAVAARALQAPFHPNHENVDWAFIPRLLGGSDNIKMIQDASEVAVMHCNKEIRDAQYGAYEYKANHAFMEYLLSVHTQDYPLHRRCFGTPQFFPCEDDKVALSDSYISDIAFIKARFAALGQG